MSFCKKKNKVVLYLYVIKPTKPDVRDTNGNWSLLFCFYFIDRNYLNTKKQQDTKRNIKQFKYMTDMI